MSTTPWPADKVERWPLDRLIPYARNPKRHSPENVAKIAASMREWGVTNPILVTEQGTIIAGHGRALAAKQLQLAEVPVMVATGWTEAQIRAYVIADNQLALLDGFDPDLLKIELADLKLMNFDVQLTGFELADIDVMLAEPDTEPPAANDDVEPDVPEPPADPITRPGDIWLLGKSHRVCCGDSTSLDAVTALMGSDRAALCVTSPPYGQQRDYVAAKEQVQNWDGLMQGVFAQAMRVMAPSGQILVNLGLIHRDNEWQPYWQGWIDWMRQQGWRRFGWYVWDQGPGMMGDWAGRLAPSFEFVFHFNQQARQPNKFIEKKPESIYDKTGECGIRDPDGHIPVVNSGKLSLQTHKIPDNVIRVMRYHGAIGDGISHPAVFPIALPEHLMLAYTDPDDIVYEPFGGSGTTILAGERCGRAVRAMELDPAYVDVICKRWRQAGYPPAVYAETGEEFPDE